MNNPFVKSPLTDNNLFAGRKTEISNIQYLLNKKHIPSIMIVGERGVGKTSLLNYIENYSKYNDIISIRINLTQSNTTDAETFFNYIFLQTCHTLIEKNFLGGQNGIIHDIIKKYYHDPTSLHTNELIFESFSKRHNYTNETFLRDINKIIDQINTDYTLNIRIIFLIDEIEKVYNSTDIIENLRFIIQNTKSNISFIFCGDKSYYDKEWERIFQTFREVIELIDVDNFQSSSDIEDYFIKILTSIKWDLKDINEGIKFKDFQKTCFELFLLTRGKPSFISSISYKMYEKFEKGITKKLVFDRELRHDIKSMLIKTGSISEIKIEYIESASDTIKEWLKYLFSCQGTNLKILYHTIKYLFVNTSFMMSEEEFSNLIGILHKEWKILALEQKKGDSGVERIGFNTSQSFDVLDRRYLVHFGENEDEATKQWLQIDSDYQFASIPANKKIIFNIMSDFLVENYHIQKNVGNIPLDQINVLTEVLQSNYIALDTLDFNNIHTCYDILKYADNTKDKINRHLLIVEFLVSGQLKSNYLCWGNDYRNKLIGINITQNKINKWQAKFNSTTYLGNENLNINIRQIVLEKPDLNLFENKLLANNDYQIQKLIIDKKIERLVEIFDESDKSEIKQIAKRLYEIFEDGLDIGARAYNNLGFVMMYLGENEKAEKLFDEAYSLFSYDNFTKEIENLLPGLTLFNMCVLHFKLGNIEKSFRLFKIIEEIEENIDKDFNAYLIVPEKTETGFLYKLCKEASLANKISEFKKIISEKEH